MILVSLIERPHKLHSLLIVIVSNANFLVNVIFQGKLIFLMLILLIDILIGGSCPWSVTFHTKGTFGECLKTFLLFLGHFRGSHVESILLRNVAEL